MAKALGFSSGGSASSASSCWTEVELRQGSTSCTSCSLEQLWRNFFIYLLLLGGLLCVLRLLIGFGLGGRGLPSALNSAATAAGAAVVVVVVVLALSEQTFEFAQIKVLQQLQVDVRGGAEEAHRDRVVLWAAEQTTQRHEGYLLKTLLVVEGTAAT